jgi:D-glycero-alpha-D-manno-heptose-7-phosphate kinase
MIIRSKAPLRIGLAGGGTDVSPYSDLYGGKVLNATINLYARVSIEPLDNGKIVLESIDMDEHQVLDSDSQLELDGKLEILKGVYNRVVRDFINKPLSFKLTTFVDVPKGSGLGSSSTITVAVLGAFVEWLNLPLGEYDIAHLAYEIERVDLKMAGGKQDQYAATFGGINFMEFEANDKVIVNPLRIKSDYLNELENNILIYYTGTSRLSAQIIEKQSENFSKNSDNAIEAAHKLKEQAVLMKEAILMGKLDRIGDILDFGWQNKKQTAGGISNPIIDELYEKAKMAGASGGKISGAGGGGFMMIYAPANARYTVIKALSDFGGLFYPFDFTSTGLTTWITK